MADVRRAYFRTLGAEAQAAAARIAEARLARHLGDLGEAIQAGAASEEARIQALARLRQSEQVRLQMETAARVERLHLGRLTGLPGTEVFPDGDLRVGLLAEPVPDAATVDGRPELFALEERRRGSENLAAAARGAYLPSVSAQISYHHAKPGVDLIADDWMQYGAAGIVLSWSLWDWGARAQRVRQARVAGRVLEEQRALLHDALQSGLAAARAALDAAREQREKATERVDLERQRLDLVRGRQRNALASESERLDAEDDLAAAEIDLAAATARLRLAETEILYLLGR